MGRLIHRMTTVASVVVGLVRYTSVDGRGIEIKLMIIIEIRSLEFITMLNRLNPL